MLLLWLLLLWGMKPGEGRIDNPKDFPQGRNAKPKDFTQERNAKPKDFTQERIDKPKDFPQGRNANPKDCTLTVEREVVVQEGLCILVPCEFSYPRQGWSASDPLHGYWFRNGSRPKHDVPVATNNPERPTQNDTQRRFILLGDLKENNCSMIIRGADKKDSGSYFFRLERGNRKWNYKQHMMTLHVTDLTNTPHVLIPENLEAGRPSNLTCSAPWACEPPTFSWTGTSVSGLNTNTNSSSVLTIIPQPWDHGTNLTCQVTLPRTGVTTRMTIRLNVSYAPKNLTVTICPAADSEPTILLNGSSLPVPEGQSLRLCCSTKSHPPANLSWTLDDLSLCPSNPSEPGVLELFPAHLKRGGVYSCHAQHALGSQHISLSLYPQRPQRSAALSGMTMGAFVGAGATALLFLFCSVILLVVRSCRKRPARPAAGAPDPDALQGSVSQSPLVEFQTDNSSGPLPPTAEAESSPTEEEIHYASLSFQEMRPRNTQGQQDTATEYSEIRSHK